MKKHMLSLLAALLLCFALPAQAEIRFENATFDGRELEVNLSVASEETPVYLILDQIELGGLPFYENSSDFADCWLGYSSDTHSESCQFTVLLKEGFVNLAAEDRAAGFEALQSALEQSGRLEASFRVTILKPKQQIVEVDTEFDGDSTATWQRINEIVASGDTPVEADEPHTARVSSEAFERIRFDEPVSFPLGNVSALHKYANMRVVEQRAIVFSVSYTKN